MSRVSPEYPSAIDLGIRRREVVRRRRLLGALALLLLMSTSPVLGHHFLAAVDWLPASLQHLGPLCMVSLHVLLTPVHAAFHWLLVAGLVVASVDRVRALRHLRRVLGRVEFAVPREGDPIFAAARLAGVDPRHVRAAPALAIPAFTAGVWSPRIYVSSDLGTWLTRQELSAVIAHEEAHRARRDPLRLSVLRFLSTVLFWLPALRRIAADLADEAEIDADTFSADRSPLALASAIVAMARVPLQPAAPQSVARFQSPDLLERRLERLAGLEPRLGTRVSKGSLVLASAALLAAWSSGVMVLHPLPSAGSPHARAIHCDTHAASPLRHVFCRGWSWGERDTPCPHQA